MMESIPNLNEARLKIVYPQIADLPYAAQEAVNILRGNLQLSGKGIQAIAVTSAHKEEGKSSVAIQLTKSFAALNKAVVYADLIRKGKKTIEEVPDPLQAAVREILENSKNGAEGL